MKTVIVVNGRPRAGKDTAIMFMRELLDRHCVPSQAFSSIDPIKEMLGGYVDLSAKSEADRKLLSVVGDALESHCGFRTSCSIQRVSGFFRLVGKGAFFLHMREPALIEVVKQVCEADGIRFIRVLLESQRAERVTSNPSDAGVADGDYEERLINDGSLDDLMLTCADFLRRNGLLP